MKLLEIFSSHVRGGAEEYTLTIATAARWQGWQVHAAFPHTEKTQSLIQDFQANQVQCHRLPIKEIPPGGGQAQVLQRLFQVVNGFIRTIVLLLTIKPDVVIVNLPWPRHCFGPILACAWLQIPTIVVFHLVPHRFDFSSRKLKRYAWARSRKQQWLTISQHQRQFIAESFNLPETEVRCIYNGIKLTAAATSPTAVDITKLRAQLCQELGIPATSILALTVGRLDKQKGYHDLIPAIPPLVKDFPNLKFLWIGDGEQRQVLSQQLKEYGVEDYVLFLGYRSDVSRFMRSADLFVFPTHFEGLSFALLEAMAHQLPIVASDASSIPEIITHKVHGLLFHVGSSYDLLEALLWALQHPYQMQEMANRALQRVEDFSEEKMLRETLALLEKLSSSL